MSETNNGSEKRTPYKLIVDSEGFNPDYEGKYLSSTEFCKLTNDIFRAAFRNYHGSKFEVNGKSPSFSLFFTHYDVESGTPDRDGEIIHVATEKYTGDKVGSTVLDKTRTRDNLMAHGDRYKITQDGKDIITPLLFTHLYNNGKPNWNQLITEIADTSGSNMYGYGPTNRNQLTKISGIDPTRVAALIWGRKDEDGIIDYGISVMRDLSVNSLYGMPGTGSNYALNITRAHTDTVSKTYEKLGLGVINSNIVRAGS